MALQFGAGSTFSVDLEGPFGSAGTAMKVAQFTAPAADWKGAGDSWFQTVTVPGISVNSKVDIALSQDQLLPLRSRNLLFMAGNEEGTVTLYALGGKPDTDLVFQAALLEVTA